MANVTFKGLWEVLKKSFSGFAEDKIPKLSAALAYYTVFSLGPLMIVIIFLSSIFFGREAVEGTITVQMQNFIGHDAASQIETIIKNASISDSGTTAAVIGIVTLLIGATTVFAEIQDSINTIWGLKAKPKSSGIKMMIIHRLLSFGVIASLGFLLIVSLAVTTIVEALGNQLREMFPNVAVVVFYIINLLLTLGIITLLFGVIFRVLPDADISWRDVLPGAIATAVLFMIGKFGISFYIGQSDIGSTYGAAGSLVVLLLWIYFSSMILYFGAEFTKAYAVKFGTEIKPNQYSVWERQGAPGEGKGTTIQEEEDLKERRLGKKKNDDDRVQIKTNIKPQRYYRIHDENLKLPEIKKTKYNDQGKKISPEKETGIGTVLGGLLIYFFRTSGDDKKDTKKV